MKACELCGTEQFKNNEQWLTGANIGGQPVVICPLCENKLREIRLLVRESFDNGEVKFRFEEKSILI